MYCANLQCPDFLRTGIHASYPGGIGVCPKCGTTLVTERPEPVIEVPDEPVTIQIPPLTGPLVTLASFNFRQDAELAASMLLANGIQAVVAGDDCGSVDPGLGFGTRTRVMVNASQAATASALLEQPAPESPADGV